MSLTRRILVGTLTTLASMIFIVSAGLAATITWTGAAADGQWFTASNWDLNRTPTTGDDVVIPNLPATTSVTHGSNVTTSVNSLACAEPFVMPTGTLNLSAASSFSNGLALSNATIGGAGNIAITGPGFDWQTGTIGGSGTMTVQAGVSWTMSGIDLGSLPGLGRPLDNFGALVITQTRGMQVLGDGVFRNQAGGSVDFRTDGSIDCNGGFQNLAGATFTRSTSTGQGLVQGGTFTNAGTVSIQSGTLFFAFTTVTNSGAMTGAPGTAVGFSGVNASFPAGSSLAMNGTLLVPSFSNVTLDPAMSSLTLAAVSLSAGNLSIGPNLSIGSLTMDGGATISGAGNLTVTNAFTMKGGTLSGSGTLTLAAGLNWTMPTSPFGSFPEIARTLNNDGSGVLTNNRLRISGGGLFRNRSSASFDIQAADPILDGSGTFENQAGATLKRTTGTGLAALQFAVTNNGTFSHQSGTLQCGFVTITNNGSLLSTGGATLQLLGTFTSTAGSSAALNGALLVDGGNVTFPASMSSLAIGGAVNMTLGTLSIGPNVSIGSLSMNRNPVLTGAGNLTITSGFSWSGGTISGSGTLALPPGLTWTLPIDPFGSRPVLQRTLNNDGNAIHTNAGGLLVDTGGLFRNRSGGTFDHRSDGSLSGSGSFDNQAGATFVRSTSAGLSTISVAFSNAGTVRHLTGALDFNGTLSNFAGTTLTGGTWETASNLRIFNAKIVTNAAAIVLDGPAATLRNSINNADALAELKTNAASGSLTLRNGAGQALIHPLANAGTIALGPGGATLTADSACVQSAGTIRLDGGTLASAAGVTLNGGSLTGSGTVDGNLVSGALLAPGASPGAISVTGNYTQQSTGQLAAEVGGTTPGSQFDALTVGGTASLNGDLAVNLVNSFNPTPGQNFDILTAGSRSGTFASSNLPMALGDNCLNLAYLANGVRVEALEGIVITLPPASQTVCEGSPVTFSVSTTGSNPVFQWRRDGLPIGGANSSSYTIPATLASDAGSYDCVVSNACGGQPSNAAILTVNVAPALTTPPTSQAVCAGSPVTFTVAATGTPAPTFQWRKDGVNIGGATAASLNIPTTVAGDAGSYDCVATNGCGNATSTPALLTVNQAPVFTLQPASQTLCFGPSVSFTVAVSGSPTPELQWRKDGVNIPGAIGASLTLPQPFPADSGRYDCVAVNSCGSDTSDPAILQVNIFLGISQHPVGGTFCAGSAITLTTAAGGTPPPSFQWLKGGAPIPGANSPTFNIPSALPSDFGFYKCVVTNVCGTQTSDSTFVGVLELTGITQQPISQSACSGSPVTFTVAASGDSPTFQWRKNGVNIGGATGSSLTINPVAAGDAGSYDCVVVGGCGNQVSAPATLIVNEAPAITTQPVTQSVCEASPVTFSVTATGTPPPTFQWRKNGVAIGGATSSSFTIAAAAPADAGNYDCVVANPCGTATSTPAALNVSAGLAITQQPVSQSTCLGSDVTFSVTVAGASPAFQWRKNGSNIIGANVGSLLLTGVTVASAGLYDCVITGGCGTLTSTAATLTVNDCLDTLFVKAGAPPGGDGQSWATAFNSLPAALAAVAGTANSREIWVAAWTYRPHASDRTASFTLVNKVSLFGGFVGWETLRSQRNPAVNVTTLSGDLLGNDDATIGSRFDNSLHVVRANGVDSTTVLDGFTVRSGMANGGTADDTESAGIQLLAGGSPRILNCIFTANRASSGGVSAIKTSGSPRFTGCTFSQNQASSGGVFRCANAVSPTFTSCIFSQNISSLGGGAVFNQGAASPTFIDCSFNGNLVTSGASNLSGGAILSFGGSWLLAGCTFTGNSVIQTGTAGGSPGGGAICVSGGAALTVNRGTFVGNSHNGGSPLAARGGAILVVAASISASDCGFYGNSLPDNVAGEGGAVALDGTGGATSGAFTNCAFSGNSALGDAGAVMVLNSNANTTFTNCTFSRNSASNNAGGIRINTIAPTTIRNCIFRGNSVAGNTGETRQISWPASRPTPIVDFTNIENASFFLTQGAGNTSLDPLLVDSDGADNVPGTLDDNLNLDSGSPAVDAGRNSFITSTTDAAGLPRFVDDPCVTDTGNGTAPIVDMGAYERQVSSCVSAVDDPQPTTPTAPATALLVGHPSPNPSTGRLELGFRLPNDGPVTAQVLDIAGRRVFTLLEASLAAGDHSVRWEGTDQEGQPAANGIYFIRVTAGHEAATRKVILTR